MLAIAELIVGKARSPNGTAFSISDTAALTARHCIFDGETPLAPLQVMLPGGKSLRASLLDADEHADVALLSLDDPLPEGWEPVALLDVSECKPRTPFLVSGYPAQRPFQDADQMDGHVVNAAATAFNGMPVISLFSPQVAAPVPRDPHGFSGAPVLVALGRDGADHAIGLIRWGEIDPVSGLVRAGSVLAAPLAPLSKRWPQIARALSAAAPRAAAPELLPGASAIRSFEVQYLGRNGKLVPFGGRKCELEKINRWVATGDRPWLMLTALAGIGKSALLVRWREQARVASVYVPISYRYGLAQEDEVLRALAAQLATAYGEPVPKGDADAMRNLIADLLSRRARERLVVVLDGLDETEDWVPGPALLGGVLGENVRILAAARSTANRPDAAAWMRVVGWSARDAEELTLTGLDLAGVAEVLASAGPPVQRLAANPAVVDRLKRLTAGDPLVLSLYVVDLQGMGDDELDAAVTKMPTEPVGLEEVFDLWWDGQRRLWAASGDEPGQAVWSTLNILACARGRPLRKKELVSITELDPEVLEDTLRSLDRFVVQGPDTGFALAHPRLADHRRQFLAAAGTLDRWEHILLGWCEGVLRAVNRDGPKHASPYAVKYLGDHLAQVGSGADRLMELVNPAWQAAWEVAVDDFNGFARDVTRAETAARREAATQIEAGVRSWAAEAAVRCALVGAGAADVTKLVSGDFAFQLVRHGVWSERRAMEAVLESDRNESWIAADLLSLAPALSRRSVITALERLMPISPDGWRAEHGEAVGALIARRAELDGASAAVTTVASMPPGTGAAVALLTLLRLRPEAAEAGAISLLIGELDDIACGRNNLGMEEVSPRLADSVSVEAIAASLTGHKEDRAAAIKFALACLKGSDRQPVRYLHSVYLGMLAPWLPSEQREAALAQVIDDLEQGLTRDADGNAVPMSSRGRHMNLLHILTAHELGQIAHRLSPALAARGAALAVSRYVDDHDRADQSLASVVVTLALQLHDEERESTLAPILADLDQLVSHGGDMREVRLIADGLGRCGYAVDLFRAAGADTGRIENWQEALQHAAPHLPKASIADALALASRMIPLYYRWLAAPLLARLASFGPTDAAAALRLAATPIDGREHTAAEALRSADDVTPMQSEPLDPEPTPDPFTRERALRLLIPNPNKTQHDYDSIRTVLDLLKELDVASAQDVARAIEGIQDVSSRNDLRGPVAVRLARMGALDAALKVSLDPYLSLRPLRAILQVTPEGRLDTWLAYVQGKFSGDIQADTRARLMQAAAGRIAACDPPGAWALLDAWLRRSASRLERLCDLLGYAPAIWATSGAGGARALADFLEPPQTPT